MACYTFSSAMAENLLRGKSVMFFGDSNIRGLYKDLIWLIEDGRLISHKKLIKRNEASHARDTRLSNGTLHNGRDYTEIRLYNKRCSIKFQFITRLYLQTFVDTINNLSVTPDFIILSSCLWDLSRWGADGVHQYKSHLLKTFTFLRNMVPTACIIWLTSLPPTFHCKGGFLTEKIQFLRNMLPWHILLANNYASDVAEIYKVDVLDLHYHFRLMMNLHTKDGIHWNPEAMRYATNLLLTHIALKLNALPVDSKLDYHFLTRSMKLEEEENVEETYS